jgi:hypothetical protein
MLGFSVKTVNYHPHPRRFIGSGGDSARRVFDSAEENLPPEGNFEVALPPHP